MSTLIRGSDNFTSKPNNQSRVLQVINKVISTQSATAIPAGRIDTLIAADYFLDIVPLGDNSIFKIYFRWLGEQSQHHDTIFNIHRNGVRINCDKNNTKFGLTGVSSSHQYTDNNSTLEVAQVITLDKTGSKAGQLINYQMVTNSVTAQTFWNNRCYQNIGQSYEQGTSEIVIMEYS